MCLRSLDIVDVLRPAMMTTGNIQCAYEKANSLDELIEQALGTKMKFTRRQRPNSVQMHRILLRKVDSGVHGQ